MGSTNYHSSLIAVSPDTLAERGSVPPKPDSIAGLQYGLLKDRPYAMTSDDLLFAVHARRHAIAEADWPAARAQFFGRPQACLRASPLVKQVGWGIHHDEAGRIALHGVETAAYRELAGRPDIKTLAGMRSKRG